MHGLKNLSTTELEHLLKLVHRGALPCPFRRATLMSMGLNHHADEGDLLFGLSEAGVRAVLVAVLAERRPRAVLR